MSFVKCYLMTNSIVLCSPRHKHYPSHEFWKSRGIPFLKMSCGGDTSQTHFKKNAAHCYLFVSFNFTRKKNEKQTVRMTEWRSSALCLSTFGPIMAFLMRLVFFFSVKNNLEYIFGGKYEKLFRTFFFLFFLLKPGKKWRKTFRQ